MPGAYSPPPDSDDREAKIRYHSEAAASKLVKAHSRGFHFLTGLRLGPKRESKVKPKSKETAYSASMDVEKDALRQPSPPTQPSGVLSALLALYDRPLSGSTTPSTAAHSPASSRSASPTREEHGHHSHFSIKGNLKHLAGKVRDDRPATARNAGGVFGTLITSAGNLSGAAAPVPSSIGPNPKRPGYHLSRCDNLIF